MGGSANSRRTKVIERKRELANKFGRSSVMPGSNSEFEPHEIISKMRISLNPQVVKGKFKDHNEP